MSKERASDPAASLIHREHGFAEAALTTPATARLGVLLLTIGYACALASGVLVAVTAPTAAQDVCGVSSKLAPLTVGTLLLGSSVSSVPSTWAMERYGRRSTFVITCWIVLLGTAAGLAALQVKSFVLLNVSTFLIGGAQGVGQFYRFAVLEVSAGHVPEEHAVSCVISGGVLAALVGPLGSAAFRDTARHIVGGAPEYTGSFAFIGVLCVVNLGVISLVRFADRSKVAAAAAADDSPFEGALRTPLLQLLVRVDVLLAVGIATCAHTSMLILMGPVTIAIQECNGDFSFTTAAYVLMVHFLCMYAPTFFTGALLERCGPFNVSIAGGLCFSIAAVLLVDGTKLFNFFGGMALVGVAWNMLFTSATVLLTSCYAPNDALRVQGLNDFIIFGCAGVGSFASGFVYDAFGWRRVCELATVFVVLELCTLAVFWVRGQRCRGPTQDRPDSRASFISEASSHAGGLSPDGFAGSLSERVRSVDAPAAMGADRVGWPWPFAGASDYERGMQASLLFDDDGGQSGSINDNKSPLQPSNLDEKPK